MYIKYIVHRDGIDHYQQIPNSNLITYSEKDLNWFGALKFERSDKRSVIEPTMHWLILISLRSTLSLIATRLDIPIKVGFLSPFQIPYILW